MFDLVLDLLVEIVPVLRASVYTKHGIKPRSSVGYTYHKCSYPLSVDREGSFQDWRTG